MANMVRFDSVVTRCHTKEDRFNTDKVFYVGGEHINSNELIVNNRGIIKGSTIGPMFYFGFKKGDVLFVSRNPHLHKAGRVTFDGICSEKTFVLESKDSTILLQEYLPFVMQTNAFWDYIEKHKSGSVNYFTNWSTLAKYEFELPSIDVQQRIAEILWAMNDTLESYKDLLAKTDEMVKAQFIEMFEDKYPMIVLGSEIKTTSGGTPSKKHDEYYANGDIPWLTSGEVNLGIIESTKNFITQTGLDNSSAKWVPANSVVIAMYGATAGKVGVIKIPLTTNQAICTLLPNPEFDTTYLYYACEANEKWMLSKCAGAAQPNISQTVIKEMLIPKPPMEIQQQFTELAKQADKSKNALQQSINSLQKLMKATINQELMR